MDPGFPTHGDWTTQDELDFIERLGKHSRGLFLGQRRRLLQGYLAGLELRAVSSFNVASAKALARMELGKLELRKDRT